ncbi:MAG: site-2 protease family protein [Patescibacteria group bacterium]|nr:site-2 protease family protein [Patescibacteria group bacterium]
MILFNLLSNPILLVGYVLGICLAISVHESAHAWVAYKLGDFTAKNMGRISLNPLAHLDPIGTIFLLLAGFGWGKPVPININSFKKPILDELKVALAGPITNFVLAVILSLILRFIPVGEIAGQIILVIIELNLVLAIFNLLPIPPLDGSAILQAILPKESYNTLRQMSTYLLFAFIIFAFATPYVSNFITGITNFLLKLLLGNSN